MRFRYEYAGKVYEVMVEVHHQRVHTVINGQEYDFELLDSQAGEIHLRLDGRPAAVYCAVSGDQVWAAQGGCSYLLKKPDPRQALAAGAPGAAQEGLRSPMPAQVRAVEVSAGQVVSAGQTLLLLEAMKMEIRLQAPRPGRVVKILVRPGETVQRDQVLLELDEPG